jgi:hypothetical protein
MFVMAISRLGERCAEQHAVCSLADCAFHIDAALHSAELLVYTGSLFRSLGCFGFGDWLHAWLCFMPSLLDRQAVACVSSSQTLSVWLQCAAV